MNFESKPPERDHLGKHVRQEVVGESVVETLAFVVYLLDEVYFLQEGKHALKTHATLTALDVAGEHGRTKTRLQ